MKWAMVLVGILVLSMCSNGESVNTTTAEDAEITTTSTSTSTTTTTTILGGGGLPTTEVPPEDLYDLTGVWDAVFAQTLVSGNEHCKVSPVQQGIVRIHRTGSTFTLSLEDGFDCRPPEACKFEGTVEGACYLATNGGVEDISKGTYTSEFELCADTSDPHKVDGAEGTGDASYWHPDFECGWTTELWITRRG